MSYQATMWAYAQPVVSTGRKFVLVALANYADEEGSCYPGQDRLAEMTGQSVRSVQRHLEQLEWDGLLSRQHRYSAVGKRTSDRYVLALHANLSPSTTRQTDATTRQTDHDYLTPEVALPDTGVALVVREPSVDPSVVNAAPPALTVNQRVKRLTDDYAAAEPMCNWPAIRGIVAKAVQAGRWDDDEIRSALQRLASEGRGVTVETLRTELDGLPPARAPNRPSTTDQRVAAGLALADRYREEETRVEEPGERTAVAGRRV